MIKLSRINKEKVKPIKLNNLDNDKRDWKGVNLFNNNLCNVFLCAKKRSGKTSTIFKILKACSDKNTNIIVFSSTVDKDPNHQLECSHVDK